MEDDGFDPLAHEDDYVGTQAWQSQTQHAGTSCGRGGFDLNSQASAAEGFPGLREYENFLQSSDVDLNPARGHPSMVPPPLHAPTMPTSTRHLNFGSSSAGAGGGVPYDRGAGSRQRTTTPPVPPPPMQRGMSAVGQHPAPAFSTRIMKNKWRKTWRC